MRGEQTFSWPVHENGPVSVTVLRLPEGCSGIVVVDDVTLGPAIGGVRMSSSVDAGEVARLARAMTLKNAAAGLSHGGGKAGIRTPQQFDPAKREKVVRAFAAGIRTLTDYIPGPDMGTDETAMAWVRDEIGRAVGLPAVLGGIPLDEIGATGIGLAYCADALVRAGRLDLVGARVAIQGFGAVGRHAAVALHDRGAQVVAVSDRSATVYDPDGLDVAAVVAAKQRGRLADYAAAKIMAPEDVITTDCELLIPAAQPDVIHEGNVEQITAAVVLPGANIAVTLGAEKALHRRGVLCMPDFVANAGGVIAAAVEYRGGTVAQAFTTIEDRIGGNTTELVHRMDRGRLLPRQAAEQMALSRIEAARAYRRQF